MLRFSLCRWLNSNSELETATELKNSPSSYHRNLPLWHPTIYFFIMERLWKLVYLHLMLENSDVKRDFPPKTGKWKFHYCETRTHNAFCALAKFTLQSSCTGDSFSKWNKCPHAAINWGTNFRDIRVFRDITLLTDSQKRKKIEVNGGRLFYV